MGGRYQISRRKRRCLSAIIATTVTTIVALSTISIAEGQACSLRDVDKWHIALSDPDAEQSPDHILDVTSAFLEACPMRPERFNAHQVAGMAAVDLGEVSLAVQHFRNAGPMTNVLANFYAISAFAAVGDDRTAWRVRDQMIERWRSRIDRDPERAFRAIPKRMGMVYEIRHIDPERGGDPSKTWVAVPFGPGWPASISVSKDPFRTSLRTISGTRNVGAVADYDLNRCSGRYALDQDHFDSPRNWQDAAALEILSAYLLDPDRPSRRSSQLNLCVWPSRLLPNVD